MLGSRISTKSRAPEAVNIQANRRQTKAPEKFRIAEHLANSEQVEQLSNETLLGVLESISDGFMAIDGQWRLTYINSVGRQLVRDEFQLGVNLWDVYPDLLGTPIEEAYRRESRWGPRLRAPT